MSHSRPKLTPSGHVEVDGASYRVVDDADRQSCAVIRDHDGAEMGRFRLAKVTSIPQADAVLAGARDPELVLAIARLLAAPRGVLPLQ